MRCTMIKLTMLAVLAAIEETQMRTFACVVLVRYLGLAGTAIAQSGVRAGHSFVTADTW
jgi:hypothetical protein